jgi:hypothetical protein
LRFGFRVLEFVESHERRTRGDASQPLAHEHRIHAHAIAGDDIRGAPSAIRAIAVVFEPHPPLQHESGQPVARRIRKRGCRLDAEQLYSAELRDVDRVAVNYCANENRFRALERRRQEYCSVRHEHVERNEQKLHRDLLGQ